MSNNAWGYKGKAGTKVNSENKIRKDEVYSSHHSCFSNKKLYERCPFTERETKIIAGETVTNFRRLDITKIIRKAESLGQYELAEKVYDMYGYLFHEVHTGDPTVAEALDILDALTPDDLK